MTNFVGVKIGDPKFGTGELRYENFGTRMADVRHKKLRHQGNFGTKHKFGTGDPIFGPSYFGTVKTSAQDLR